MNLTQKWDVIIIGAGAAGLMCAATVGYQGLAVLVIDHAPKAAAKIRISGGGKCNFTNLDVTAKNFICQNPHFVKSALSRYPSSAFIEMVERHGLHYEQRELGKLFCKQGASDLIQILRAECTWAQVTFSLKTEVNKVQAVAGGFQVDTSVGALSCSKLVIATGALSFPKLKASGFGYAIAEQFGLKVLPTRPGLVPLNFEGKWHERIAELSGLSLDVAVSVGGKCFHEAMLFTHQGLSGPSILQASNYWREGEPIQINLLPNSNVLDDLKQLRKQASSLNRWLGQFWPKRFMQFWLTLYPAPEDIANASDETLEAYARQLTEWSLYPSETAGYDKAEVTLGGVDTDEVSSKTLEAKKQHGLYFIGEVLDVTGQLGGYNFQWAWASGVACGTAIASSG
ncbi:HI0933 family flavoprotein YhiN [Thiosulfatimonas sediminis]|uniref:HI0933 family flavoprotein YhiN n=1 Tax=Thiosulfatimonas sediminis TaxID=2675054 RepID=A0A6F8PRV7_9GAMM|nr:NAD(P)/FAD-dependent oxidoreductase [Thiosulfatimonas sediminis]BBP44767.1 HI0933 family flavoprotein YhiN [Thiosulfatimonas sediminis]